MVLICKRVWMLATSIMIGDSLSCDIIAEILQHRIALADGFLQTPQFLTVDIDLAPDEAARCAPGRCSWWLKGAIAQCEGAAVSSFGGLAVLPSPCGRSQDHLPQAKGTAFRR